MATRLLIKEDSRCSVKYEVIRCVHCVRACGVCVWGKQTGDSNHMADVYNWIGAYQLETILDEHISHHVTLYAFIIMQVKPRLTKAVHLNNTVVMFYTCDDCSGNTKPQERRLRPGSGLTWIYMYSKPKAN